VQRTGATALRPVAGQACQQPQVVEELGQATNAV
jgi:hypothetical protein